MEDARASDRPHRLSVRTATFHGAERGSIPLGAIATDCLTTSRGSRQVRGEERVSDPDFSSWGRSSVWLEHSTVTREVAGSSAVGPVLLLLKKESRFAYPADCGLKFCRGGEIG